MTILITGGNGYIAKSIYNSLKEKHDVTIINRSNFDLTNRESTDIFFKNRSFDAVINCAVSGGNRMIKDDWDIMDTNLKIYYNLLANKDHFTKFIHFGSGAELYNQTTPYGLSKHVIRQSILEKDSFYNLRIFAVFDENELDTRFIKSSITRYINEESIEVYEDKYMDFIYMPDLIKIVYYYIENNNNLPKEIDCSYNTVRSLTRIAEMINNLDTHKVKIEVGTQSGTNYIGSGFSLYMDFIGLEKGIKQVYEKLKNEI